MVEYRIFSAEEGERRAIFCNNLRYTLRVKGISRETMAKKLGVCLTTVKNYANGRTYPDDIRIKQIADILGCTVDDLFDENYEP